MTEAEKLMVYEMIDKLEAEVGGLVKKLGDSREWTISIQKMEECAMWMRRAVDRS